MQSTGLKRQGSWTVRAPELVHSSRLGTSAIAPFRSALYQLFKNQLLYPCRVLSHSLTRSDHPHFHAIRSFRPVALSTAEASGVPHATIHTPVSPTGCSLPSRRPIPAHSTTAHTCLINPTTIFCRCHYPMIAYT
jgi:hypothetical protein